MILNISPKKSPTCCLPISGGFQKVQVILYTQSNNSIFSTNYKQNYTLYCPISLFSTKVL